ncbi:MAG: HD domain-containing protein, partial [Chlorobi bacterium]|nr:HD domain-containing protein [Chlorobiota bacterium]
TKAFDPKEGWTFHGHDAVGAKMVPKIFKRLHLPLDSRMKKVKKLVALHQRPIALTQEHVTDSGIRRLINDAGDLLEDLLTLCRADITSSRPEKVKRYLKNFDELEKRIKEVEERDRIRNFQPPISGEIIMKVFDIPPSKPVGIIKKAIKDAILDGEIRNDFVEAFEYMLKKGRELGLKPKYTLAEFIQLAKQEELAEQNISESDTEQDKPDDNQ